MSFVNTTSPSHAVGLVRLWRWLDRHCPWVLRGCAVPYGAVAQLRRTAYQRGWFSQHRLPRPVISVGNLTVGGTGKTPLVMWLAARLHEQGKRVAILSRGYGRQRAAVNRLVSDGMSLKGDWRSVGDEAMLMAQTCPWAIVAVGSDRYRLGQWVLEQVSCDCFLLDDGFQHLPLYRDLNVLLFDATDVEGLNGVVPAGRMREPLSAAKWATTIVFSRMEQILSVESLRVRIEQGVGTSIVPLYMEIAPGKFTHIATGKTQKADAFKDTSCLLISGIGNPASFRSSVVSCGLMVGDEVRYPDHFAYSEKDIEGIRLKMRRLGFDLVITTEKDALKIREYLKDDDPLWALDVQVRMTQGEAQLRKQLHAICP
ncbi:MAG: tetraacyldisaccharide 4'-kinase [Nitrospirae bacterium CG_4_9_14_3_um_filter_51_5]|nr:MAG: tetraacyldisaccharide 4'-kinase [Nitrospirae bacterium CG_4_9_14_3_um_filter_51_5]